MDSAFLVFMTPQRALLTQVTFIYSLQFTLWGQRLPCMVHLFKQELNPFTYIVTPMTNHQGNLGFSFDSQTVPKKLYWGIKKTECKLVLNLPSSSDLPQLCWTSSWCCCLCSECAHLPISAHAAQALIFWFAQRSVYRHARTRSISMRSPASCRALRLIHKELQLLLPHSVCADSGSLLSLLLLLLLPLPGSSLRSSSFGGAVWDSFRAARVGDAHLDRTVSRGLLRVCSSCSHRGNTHSGAGVILTEWQEQSAFWKRRGKRITQVH